MMTIYFVYLIHIILSTLTIEILSFIFIFSKEKTTLCI